jgi:glycosyltransferase involved in cell wall biosynthesis
MIKNVLNIAYIGNYLPRACGIAAFTTDLCETTAKLLSPKSNVFSIAVNDNENGYNYPPRVAFTINQSVQKDYFEAANLINTSNADIACIQHEYGIYGGWDGIYILSLISSLNIPLVVTLYTVLNNPTPNQKKIIQEIALRASKIVVMCNLASDFLKNIYKINPLKIEMIHHGTPDFSSLDTSHYKKRFKLEGRQTLLTFGLLSPNKGIETVIKALPRVVSEFPDLTYVVLGQTHPHIKKAYGEQYRDSLIMLVEKLKLQAHVTFDNRFVTLEELYAWLLAADIYITPYINEAQIVSGTLAYAIGAGKSIISTPYWYAKELLSDGRGRLIDFNNPDKLVLAMKELLANKEKIKQMQKKANALGRQMRWGKVAKRYLDTFTQVIKNTPKRAHTAVTSISFIRLPPFDLTHLKRLTDDTGLIQHAKYIIPDRHTGYCLDDNARAMMLCAWAVNLLKNDDAKRLLSTYLSFAHFMQRPDGRFRNFIDYQRRYMDEVGSDDSFGRALHALGYIIWKPPGGAYRSIARDCFGKALPHVKSLNLRGKALAMLGLIAYLWCFQGDEDVSFLLKECADSLVDMYEKRKDDNWKWFEDILCYDNAVIPMALFQAYSILHKEKYLETAKETLDFLEENTFRYGHLSIIGSNGWYVKGEKKAKFDQQPIDATAMVLAFQSAYKVTNDKEYLKKMKMSFYWFLGENDMSMSLYDYETKGCADGLLAQGVSLNQGGESTVSFLTALLAMIEEYEIENLG